MKISNEKYKLTTDVFGGNTYMNTETLTLNAAGQPEKLEIFDRNNSLKLELKYSEFQTNPKLDEKLFNMY
jgi:outer membrane lipoprotein-sorting protein